MDWQGWFALALAGVALILMSSGRYAPHLVLMCVLIVLSASGIISADQALSGFSNTGLITVVALFVVAAGIHHSGGVDLLVRYLLRNPKTVRTAQARITLPVALLSGFLNNTPVVATMIPAVHAWSRKIGISPSKLMIPLSYSAILGGTLTMIGTSTNLVVNGQYEQLTGDAGLSIFSITAVGLPVAVMGIAAILLFMPQALPSREGRHKPGSMKGVTREAAVAIDGSSHLPFCRPAFANNQRCSQDFPPVNDLEAEIPGHNRAWLSWGILIVLVGLAACGVLSMLNAALMGAALMILSGCCSAGQAQKSVDVPVVLTIAASFALGAALQETGAATFVAGTILGLGKGHVLLVLFLVYCSVSVLTEIITNNAAAVLVIPVVLSMTNTMGVAAEPFVIAVMMAASASFATPLGYQTNMMVYGPGGYRFGDFVRVGLPMNVFIGLVSVAVIAMVYGISPSWA